MLVKHYRFTYEDVKEMSKSERAVFLEFFTKELEEQDRASKQHNRRR